VKRRQAALVALWLALGAAGVQAQVTVVLPAASTSRDGPEAASLAALVAELAQRCPSARYVPFAPIARLLPRFSRLSAPAPAPPLPAPLLDPEGTLLSGTDPLGGAVRFTRAAAELEADPVALLSVPGRRLRLREAYLYAARALLRAGDGGAAQAVLAKAAVRLPDLPAITPAQWGPQMAAAEEHARRRLPEAMQEVVVEGPAGWAVHVDEQPAGPLPQQHLRLRPGPHAVVVVGPDGTRVGWPLDLPALSALRSGAPLRLIADARLGEACEVAGLLGLCSAAERPESGPILVRLLDSDVIVVHQQGAGLSAWRLQRGGGAPRFAAVSLAGSADQALLHLAGRLCPAPAAAPHGVAIARSGPRPRPRGSAWPGGLLVTAGLLSAGVSAPLFAYDGRCVDLDCTIVYDFHALPPVLTAAGGALVLGGAIWLGLALRR
jgi:hypothetical protein